ncbi:response regulator [Roseiconus lacunae]|nr:response regulator [Roseiconus lacunae]
MAIRSWLSSLGFECFECGNGGEAATLIETLRPSIVVTDIDMPGGDGVQLIRNIRESTEPELIKMPVLVISSLEDTMIEDFVQKVGGSAFASKPLDRDQFLMAFFATLRGSECWGSFTQAFQVATVSPKLRRYVAQYEADWI